MAASSSWNMFHIDLKTAFLQRHSYGVNLDFVCQLPPPYIAARLKNPAYGMNDAPRHWWNILDNALSNYGTVRTRADRCRYVLYSSQCVSEIGTKRAQLRVIAHMASHLNRLLDHTEMQHLRKCWLSLKEAEMEQRVPASFRKDFHVGSENWNDVTFTRQNSWFDC